MAFFNSAVKKAFDAYKKENYPKRALFTRHFYDYVKANPQLKKTYTQWTKEMGFEF